MNKKIKFTSALLLIFTLIISLTAGCAAEAKSTYVFSWKGENSSMKIYFPEEIVKSTPRESGYDRGKNYMITALSFDEVNRLVQEANPSLKVENLQNGRSLITDENGNACMMKFMCTRNEKANVISKDDKQLDISEYYYNGIDDDKILSSSEEKLIEFLPLSMSNDVGGFAFPCPTHLLAAPFDGTYSSNFSYYANMRYILLSEKDDIMKFYSDLGLEIQNDGDSFTVFDCPTSTKDKKVELTIQISEGNENETVTVLVKK